MPQISPSGFNKPMDPSVPFAQASVCPWPPRACGVVCVVYASPAGWVSLIICSPLPEKLLRHNQITEKWPMHKLPNISFHMKPKFSTVAQLHNGTNIIYFTVHEPVKSGSFRCIKQGIQLEHPRKDSWHVPFHTTLGLPWCEDWPSVFTITSKNLLSPSTSFHLHSHQLSPSYHHFSPGLLQQSWNLPF